MTNTCALAYDTIIPTVKGLKKIQDIKVNDMVFGLDGMPIRVTDVFDIGKCDTYNIYMDDSKFIRVGGDQLIPVAYLERMSDDDEFPYLIPNQIRAKDMFNSIWNIELDNQQVLYHYITPYHNELQYPYHKVKIDPTIAGYILAGIDLSKKQFTMRAVDISIARHVAQHMKYHYERIDDQIYQFFDRWGAVKTRRIRRLLGINRYESYDNYSIPMRYICNVDSIRQRVATAIMFNSPYTADSAERHHLILFGTKNQNLLYTFTFLMGSLKIKTHVSRVADSDGIPIIIAYQYRDGYDEDAIHVIINIEKDKICECRSITTESDNGIFLAQQFLPVADENVEV